MKAGEARDNPVTMDGYFCATIGYGQCHKGTLLYPPFNRFWENWI